jgi:hypothetical protein
MFDLNQQQLLSSPRQSKYTRRRGTAAEEKEVAIDPGVRKMLV